MKILVTGATGFIGKALVLRLRRDGHRIVAWTRRPGDAASGLGPDVEIADAGAGPQALARAVDGCDAVVNLAGAPVVGGRWTAARKRELVDSRVGLTRELVEAVGAARHRPGVLVSASAVGFYGDRGDVWADEDAAVGDGFLASLCEDWERAAFAAEAHGARVAAVRIGVVLGVGGGALERMLPAFRAGVGGKLGSGRQFMPWIHLHDIVEVLAAAVADERYRGVINGVAPNPVTNAELTRALGAALARPTVVRVPGLALRIALGDASQVVLRGQRVNPARLRDLAFRFRYERVEQALTDIVGLGADVSIERVDAGELPDAAYLRERGARYRLTQTTVIDASVDDVFAFFSRAENLGAITPPDMGFTITTPRPIEMGAGTRITYEIKLGPVPLDWETVIDAWEPGSRFVDSQQSGPYRSWWHEHQFRAMGHRTVMEDRVYYAPPLGPLGWIAHRLFVARQLRRIFGYRSTAIEQRFGGRAIPKANAA